ncbi:MAG: CBS domain-containing protein [Bdellovibrionales bacterium]
MKNHRLAIPVEEFTTPNPIVVTESTSIEVLQALMHEHGVRHLPVVRGNQVVGIVSDRDVRVVLGLSQIERSLVKTSDIMAAEPVSISSSTLLDEAAFIMSQQKIGSVIVTDDNEELLGIFTVTDALNALIEIARGDDISGELTANENSFSNSSEELAADK